MGPLSLCNGPRQQSFKPFNTGVGCRYDKSNGRPVPRMPALLQVHDELAFGVEHEQVAKNITEIMCDAIELSANEDRYRNRRQLGREYVGFLLLFLV